MHKFPETPNISASPPDLSQMGGAARTCLGSRGKMQTPGARASPAFQGDFEALRSHPPLGSQRGHNAATSLCIWRS